jgi:hypothetical protein
VANTHLFPPSLYLRSRNLNASNSRENHIEASWPKKSRSNRNMSIKDKVLTSPCYPLFTARATSHVTTANYHLHTVVFFKTLHLKSSFAGTTISCLLGKQLQEVQKSVSWLRDLWYSQGHAEIDQCMVFSMYCSDGSPG